jgi:hypothetical protein
MMMMPHPSLLVFALAEAQFPAWMAPQIAVN